MRSWTRTRRCARSRSSSARARSPGLGGVLPAREESRRRSRASAASRSTATASAPRRTPRFAMLDAARLHRITRRRDRPAGRHQVRGRRHRRSGATSRADRYARQRAADFITIDGGEGGTGAAPLVFTDHVALPFKLGFSRVYATFAERGVHEQVVFIGSGKLGFPEAALLALALGCDMINVAREAMLSIGCIQAQRCHTGHCPTGVATQNAWLDARPRSGAEVRAARELHRHAAQGASWRCRGRAACLTRRSCRPARSKCSTIDSAPGRSPISSAGEAVRRLRAQPHLRSCLEKLRLAERSNHLVI